jgi:membrane associated rhomboid family serine protease
MNLLVNLKQTFLQGSAVIRLIYLNVALYLLLQIIGILLKLFNIDGSLLFGLLALPSEPVLILHRPWTLLTYMFLHQDFFHILFNMFALYWFSKVFLMYFSEKQLYGLYVIGGLAGGLLYVVAYNIFPLFLQREGLLMGASGSITAIILAVALNSPNLGMRFLLIGNVKLKFIALAVVLISFFGITSSNAGGEIAHLGGALYGYIFIVSLRRGKDNTRGFSKLMDSLSTLFKPRRLKVKRTAGNKKMNDQEYNMSKAANMAEIDRILDKIKASGYGSLTDEEKRKLFEQSKK